MIGLNEAARDAVISATGIGRVYAVGAVPAGGERVYPYVVVALTYDEAANYSLAHHGTDFYRLTTQTFGRTADAALDVDQSIRGALLDQRLSATGWACDPVRLQVAGALVNDPDAGQVIGVVSTYRFTAHKETTP